MNPDEERHTGLPIVRSLAAIYVLSLITAILMAAASVVGLLYPTIIYPTDELVRAFVTNDAVSIFIGLPILLGSMWLTRRGRLIGLLCWPGALLFALYNYTIYVLAMPLNVAFLLHLALVAMSVYTLIGLGTSIDGKAVQQRLAGAVPERLAGGVLAALGSLFLLWAIGMLASSIASHTPMADTERARQIADSLITPAWVIGGVMLWRRKALGYVSGLGLLFSISMLFVALIIFLLLQPLLTAAPFALADLVVILVMGLVCFVPFVLFVRGVAVKRPRP